jgi:uncharacterized SAM-binding protein YcdF (DUF218 family)
MSRADAIVVLGCRMPEDGRPGGALERRVAHAAELWRRGEAPLLLLSGGGGRQRSEADAMRELAVTAGVPRDTIENAVFSAALLREKERQRVIVVSEAYHLLRARILFRATGLEVVAASAPPVRLCRDFLMYLRESVALPRSLLRLALGGARPK